MSRRQPEEKNLWRSRTRSTSSVKKLSYLWHALLPKFANPDQLQCGYVVVFVVNRDSPKTRQERVCVKQPVVACIFCVSSQGIDPLC